MLLEKKQTDNFEFHLPYMLHHIMNGEIKKGKCFGIHYFQKDNHLVEEIINQPNEKGVWEAKIKTKHYKTNAWVIKEKASTFFPVLWNEEILILKLKESFENKKKIKPYKYIGTTSCGINIAFLFQNNIVTSCYPIFINS